MTDCAALESEIEEYRPYEDWVDEFDMDCPIITRRGEEVLLIARGAFLTETRRGRRTSYRGRSHGMSIRIMKGAYYRPSAHSGSVEQAPEQTEVIDSLDGHGVFVVTNQRGVSRGNLHTREFRWKSWFRLPLSAQDRRTSQCCQWRTASAYRELWWAMSFRPISSCTGSCLA